MRERARTAALGSDTLWQLGIRPGADAPEVGDFLQTLTLF